MILVKIGGGHKINLPEIIKWIKTIEDDVIIIHGANSKRDTILTKLGFDKKTITSISGLNSVYSDDNLIDVMLMTYKGLVNANIVEQCQQLGINAIGLSGLDGGLILGKRNKGIRTIINQKKKIIRDRSGKAVSINTDLIYLLINNGYTPVITVPILDENNIAINSENDDIVALFSELFEISKIYFLIEEKGFIYNNEILDYVDTDLLDNIFEKSTGRIKRKLNAIKRILNTDSVIHMLDGRIYPTGGTIFQSV